MRPGRSVLFIWAVLAFSALAGCSNPLPRSEHPFGTSPRMAVGPTAPARMAEDIAVAALDGERLAAVRGGFIGSSGISVTFSFQEATFVNGNLAQTLVVPTFTISPDSPAAAVITTAGNGSVLPAGLTAGGVTGQVQLSSSAATVQSIVNNGLTRVLSSLGAGGISSTISNSANNQLVQQVMTANIDINGLSKLLQPSTAATLMSPLQAANAQFR